LLGGVEKIGLPTGFFIQIFSYLYGIALQFGKQNLP